MSRPRLSIETPDRATHFAPMPAAPANHVSPTFRPVSILRTSPVSLVSPPSSSLPPINEAAGPGQSVTSLQHGGIASMTPAGGAEPRRSGSQKRQSRIIRTFEEVQVTKTVTTEEWYEELECGVCAHILGAPQALVPCGHSLCGPCAWEWIKKNKLHEQMPFVPNIVVDQIIERKLRSLPDSAEKSEMITERRDKAEAWKLVQAALQSPAKSARWRWDLFDTDAMRQNDLRRRASRHVPELGMPLSAAAVATAAINAGPRDPTRPYGARMNLAEIRRHEVDEQLPSPAELRRLRQEAVAREAALRRLEALAEEPTAPAPMPREARDPRAQRSVVVNTIPMVPAGTSGENAREDNGRLRVREGREGGPSGPRALGTGRLGPVRSTSLAARQARGRGTREQPLVVLSDSD